jgi:hypothetical protein
MSTLAINGVEAMAELENEAQEEQEAAERRILSIAI